MFLTLGSRAAIVLTFFLISGCAVAPDDSAESISAPQIGIDVTVTGGMVRGLFGREGSDNLKQYHGIPYAAPPIGDLRWAPPTAVVPWEGVRDATSPGPFCSQPRSMGVGFYIIDRPNRSEDCLTINVWTRAEFATERRPVMFWIHGGGLEGGSGSEQAGDFLTQKGVVLVTFNYRLGRLGFLAHPERIGIITGLFDRKSEYRVRSVACLFYESV